jgi:hypothetical protein
MAPLSLGEQQIQDERQKNRESLYLNVHVNPENITLFDTLVRFDWYINMMGWKTSRSLYAKQF